MSNQVEQGTCTGRGFSDVDANGWCAKLKTWIAASAASGGAGWTILRDVSTTTDTAEQTVSSINTSTEEWTVTGHPFKDKDKVRIVADSTPGGMSTSNDYFVKVVDANTVKLCYHWQNVERDIPQNVSSSGSNVRLYHAGPHIWVADSTPSDANDPVKILKIGYSTSSAGTVTIQAYLGWNGDTAVYCYGGYRLDTVDAGDFIYDFRGGEEFLFLQTKIPASGSWYRFLIDEWTGLSGHLDASSVGGTAAASFNVTGGSATNVSVQLQNSTQANSFTKGQGYFLYDFENSNKSLINYGIIDAIGTADGLASDSHIRFATLQNAMSSDHDTYPIGTIITPYAHRFVICGNQTLESGQFCDQNSVIPYIDYNYNYYDYHCHNQESGAIYAAVKADVNSTALTTANPADDGTYAVQRPLLVSYRKFNSTSSATEGMNRLWGQLKNVYVVDDDGLVDMEVGRVVNSEQYLCFGAMSSTFVGGVFGLSNLILHTEST